MALTIVNLLLTPFLLTSCLAYTPYPSIPTTGDIFGVPPYLSVSYYYPIAPLTSHKSAYSLGTWPPHLPIRPSSIYECMPPPDRGFEPRTYTCKNHQLADDRKTPEGIRAYEETRARSFDGSAPGVCDANTGLAMETLHWGTWQHNCWSSTAAIAEHSAIQTQNPTPKWENTTTTPQKLSDLAQQHIQWNLDALYWRCHILLQLSAHNYHLNTRIRSLWADKNRDLQDMQKLQNSWKMSDKQRWREMNKREARFWRETWAIREAGREIEKWVPVYFERRMQGRKEGFEWLGLGDVVVQA